MSMRDLWDLLAPTGPQRVTNWGEAISDKVDAVELPEGAFWMLGTDDQEVADNNPTFLGSPVEWFIFEDDESAPDAPTLLDAAPGDGEVFLTWQFSLNADGHRVYRNTTNDFGTALQIGADLGAEAESFTDDTVTNDTEYFYWVTAFNTFGESDPSTVASATPAEAAGVPVTSGLEFHYDAQSLSLDDNDPVATWPDLSPNERNLTHDAGTQATYIASSSTWGGRPVVRSTSATRYNWSGTLTLTQPNTVFVVLRQETLERGSHENVFDGVTGTARHFLQLDNNTRYNLFAGNQVTSPTSASTLQKQLLRAYFDGASSSLHRDGNLVHDGDVGAHDLGGGIYLFDGRGTAGANDMLGDIAEFLIYSRTLTAQEIEDVETYLNNRWGL